MNIVCMSVILLRNLEAMFEIEKSTEILKWKNIVLIGIKFPKQLPMLK